MESSAANSRLDWKEAIEKGLIIDKQSELLKSNRSDNDDRSRRNQSLLNGRESGAEDKAHNAALGGLSYLDLKIKGRLNTIREEGLENELEHTVKQDNKEQQNSEEEIIAAEPPIAAAVPNRDGGEEEQKVEEVVMEFEDRKRSQKSA